MPSMPNNSLLPVDSPIAPSSVPAGQIYLQKPGMAYRAGQTRGMAITSKLKHISDRTAAWSHGSFYFERRHFVQQFLDQSQRTEPAADCVAQNSAEQQ